MADTKTLGENPKDRQAAKKCDISVFPAIGLYHGAHAMVDGALKYGPYNWRENAVLARVYIGAMKRHIARWEAGEEHTAEGTHNLGNVMACCAILLDAQATGNLGDDRAKNPAILRLMDEVDAKCKALEEAAKARATAVVEAEERAMREQALAEVNRHPQPLHDPDLSGTVEGAYPNNPCNCAYCRGEKDPADPTPPPFPLAPKGLAGL